ncbi:MAG: LysR family transcriptional regulator [Pseudomonadota bacterium]
MRFWLELKTALVLSRKGTVSATAKEIGVHRSTVNRHIDTLEAAFNHRIFQRHARGYALTEAGREIAKVAENADAMFSELQTRQLGAASLTLGTLKITAIAGVAPMLMSAVKSFRMAHPNVKAEFIADTQLLQLEAGEAHVAFRSGPEPREPDYVVQALRPFRFSLYASRDYIDRFGTPRLDSLDTHQFVAPIPERTYPPYQTWFAQNVSAESVVLTSASRYVRYAAICNGIGL